MRGESTASDTAGRTRRRAAEAAGGQALLGPLAGHHHETYAFPLPMSTNSQGRWKLREPRPNLIWFDRRAFVDEEELLTALAGRVKGVPDVMRTGTVTLQRYIEGDTLGTRFRPGTRLPGSCLAQLMELVRELAAIRPDSLSVRSRVLAEGEESIGFVEQLVVYAEEHVYARNEHRFGTLFRDLGIDALSFRRLRKGLEGLAARPFHLLHGDLHRDNLIIDPEGRLWAIDWELAVFGDPLYDLATHLYLMRYPEGQADRVAEHWVRAVESALPGASRHWQDDLPRILAFKRAQSVFTDVIRTALDLGNGTPLRVTAPRLHTVLRAGAEPLGLETVPTPWQTAVALTRWRREFSDMV